GPARAAPGRRRGRPAHALPRGIPCAPGLRPGLHGAAPPRVRPRGPLRGGRLRALRVGHPPGAADRDAPEAVGLMGFRARALRTLVALARRGILALAATAPAAGEAFIRYSGHVMEVDLRRGILVVEELGRRGLPIRHEVRVEQDTPVIAASR